LLGYEGWAVLHQEAARTLQPIIDEGVAVEIFYEQQIHSLPAWFSRGHVRHDDIRAVIDWMRTQWRATATWPAVLSTTAILVHAHAPVEDVPDLLIELAAIALSFGGMEAAEQAAGHARSALTCIGDNPSVTRCRALRSLATATMTKGEHEAGLAILETAITIAVMIKNQVEEARALHQIGFHALSCGHFARAEDGFCRAIGVLSDNYSQHLQATLHHDLALALHAQSKNEDAERHAIEALALRWRRESRLAREDRALIARIRASRPAQLG
jgi:ATP/maltotriose-dependent transcriptional regulator MalT